MTSETLLSGIRDIAREAGEIILSAENERKKVTSKTGTANFVTEYDVKVQHFLQKELSGLLSEAGFLGEEEEEMRDLSREYVFVVDPIDGTTNFIRNYRMSCVSIALLRNSRPVIGVIYNPYSRECFYAEKGKGAFCNGRPIRVTENSLADSLVIMGTSPYDRSLTDITFRQMREFFDHSLDIRRSGSAAIDLCSVSCGRADAFLEMSLKPWDYAAGALIVTEAGGRVTDVNGEEPDFLKPSPILAGGLCHAECLRHIVK